jgi:mannitol 2-dehydrogenase
VSNADWHFDRRFDRRRLRSDKVHPGEPLPYGRRPSADLKRAVSRRHVSPIPGTDKACFSPHRSAEGIVMQTLTAATVSDVGNTVPTPDYDRTRLATGIVHFGVGGFHRAHQAMYLDQLMSDGKASEWGICGVGVMPSDRRMKDVLQAQDGLYTLVQKNPDGSLTPRVIGSIIEYLFVADDPEAVIEKMADERTRIVSLTVTEGGYNVDHVTGQFDASNPDVQRDLQRAVPPQTVFGLVTEALARRRERKLPPFTVMSCDNVQGNGVVARAAFTAFAQLRDPDLAEWIRDNVAFPNSMVDRITPGTTEDDRVQLRDFFGVDDQWPVVCEPFTQWVLQDEFTDGRPPLEEVGVQLVADVEPYELMKLRLLNAGHQALSYFGYLAGYRYVHEVSQDPLFRKFLLGYMLEEAIPTLPPVAGIDLEAYAHTLLDRFASAAVRDTLVRNCADTSDRMPKFLFPVVREQLKAGAEVRRAIGVIASWARYAEGIDEQGQPIDVVDPLRGPLMAEARRQREEPLAFISNREVFGDLVDDTRFAALFASALTSLHQNGARATVKMLSADSPPR